MSKKMRIAGSILLCLAATSLIASLVTLQIAPYSHDLFHLIYGEGFRERGESTFIFLFFFPLLQFALVAIFFYLAPAKQLKPEKRGIMIVASIIFLLINVWRCTDTWIAFS